MADTETTTELPRETAAQIVFDMEDDIYAIGDYARAFLLMASALSSPRISRPFPAFGLELETLSERLEETYRELFDATRPQGVEREVGNG